MSRLEATRIPEAICEYLITKQNYEAAEAFVEETKQSRSLLKSVRVRKQVTESILGGDIEGAIELISQADPSLFEKEPEIYFDLLLMQLIELIRASDFDADQHSIDGALQFAKTRILPILGSDSDSQERMFRFQLVMALICLDTKKELPSALADLLDNKQRRKLAEKVDYHFLRLEGRDYVSGLEMYVRLTDLIRARFDEDTDNVNKLDGLNLISL